MRPPLKLVPIAEKRKREVNNALEDLISLANQGLLDGLLFQFHTCDGKHFNGLSGYYRVHLIETVGSLTNMKHHLCKTIGSDA